MTGQIRYLVTSQDTPACLSSFQAKSSNLPIGDELDS
jgi:hypothetical protein